MSRGIDVNLYNAKQVPENAELKVNLDQKVSGVSDMQDTKKAAMQSAYYNCITQNNIDVVVDPIVKLTKYSTFTSRSVKNTENAKWWIPQYKAEILGYGGTYVKFEKDADQVKKYDNINMESIVKYKLVTDPSFHKSYYNNQKNNNNTVNFNSGKTKEKISFNPSPASPIKLKTTPQTVAPIKYKEMMQKGLNMRNAGITMFSIGVALLAPIGATVFTCVRGDTGYVAGINCMSIGGALVVVGSGLWGGGCAKIKKAKNQNLAIGYNVNPTEAQLAVNF